MKIGLLWQDHTTDSLEEIIKSAAKQHKKKYGTRANRCYVNPSALPNGPCTIAGVRVSALFTVLIGHYWIGIEKKSADV